MKLSRSDLGPLAAIAVGACVGAAFSMSLRAVPAAEHVVREKVLERASPAQALEPLIYIDGVRVAAGTSLDDIDPDTIERMEVVKGDAAVALFGAEAAAGVVQIFLKVIDEG